MFADICTLAGIIYYLSHWHVSTARMDVVRCV